MNTVVKNALNEAYERGDKYVLSYFLKYYYSDTVFRDIDEDYWNEEVFLPLEDRPSGVLEALEEIMPMVVNINDESEMTPLEYAVGCIDYYMAKYLIEHGADPNCWEEREEMLKDSPPCENWYLEDLDVALVNNLDVKNEIIYNHVYKLIELLTAKGKYDSYRGLCITYDAKSGEIDFGNLQLKY